MTDAIDNEGKTNMSHLVFDVSKHVKDELYKSLFTRDITVNEMLYVLDYGGGKGEDLHTICLLHKKIHLTVVEPNVLSRTTYLERYDRMKRTVVDDPIQMIEFLDFDPYTKKMESYSTLIQKSSFPHHVFDLIFCHMSFSSAFQTDQTLSFGCHNAFRFLKPGGRLVVFDFIPEKVRTFRHSEYSDKDSSGFSYNLTEGENKKDHLVPEAIWGVHIPSFSSPLFCFYFANESEKQNFFFLSFSALCSAMKQNGVVPLQLRKDNVLDLSPCDEIRMTSVEDLFAWFTREEDSSSLGTRMKNVSQAMEEASKKLKRYEIEHDVLSFDLSILLNMIGFAVFEKKYGGVL